MNKAHKNKISSFHPQNNFILFLKKKIKSHSFYIRIITFFSYELPRYVNMPPRTATLTIQPH
jgi:hypothetical protein